MLFTALALEYRCCEKYGTLWCVITITYIHIYIYIYIYIHTYVEVREKIVEALQNRCYSANQHN